MPSVVTPHPPKFDRKSGQIRLKEDLFGAGKIPVRDPPWWDPTDPDQGLFFGAGCFFCGGMVTFALPTTSGPVVVATQASCVIDIQLISAHTGSTVFKVRPWHTLITLLSWKTSTSTELIRKQCEYFKIYRKQVSNLRYMSMMYHNFGMFWKDFQTLYKCVGAKKGKFLPEKIETN